MEDNLQGMKNCVHCKEDKDVSQFSRKSTATDGLKSWCKDCVAAYRKAYYAEHAEQAKREARTYASTLRLHRSALVDKKKEDTPCFFCKELGFSKEKVLFSPVTQRRIGWWRLSEERLRVCDVACIACVEKNTTIRLDRKRNNARFRANIILEDYRSSDRRYGRENDLDLEFIQSTIATDCPSCGETDLKMTLDRIDNSRGHTKDNVVPACYRCNMFRRNLPYEAWKLLWDGMRRARERGLLVGWNAGVGK